MNNKLKLLPVKADRTKMGIIGAQVCHGMLKYAQLSYPQISVSLSGCMCEVSGAAILDTSLKKKLLCGTFSPPTPIQPNPKNIDIIIWTTYF